MASLRKPLTVIQPLLTGVAFVLLAVFLVSQWDSLRTAGWQQIRPLWVVGSGGALLAGWAIEVRMWQRLLNMAGGRLGYWESGRIWFIGTIGRYIPGNIWQPLNLTMLCGRRGIRAEAALASLSLFHIVHLAAIGSIAAVAAGQFLAWWSGLALAIPIVLFLLRPGIILSVANSLLTRMGRGRLEIDLTPPNLMHLFGLSLAAWVLFGMSFLSMTAAVAGFETIEPHIGRIVAAYPIAYAVGFFSIVTPGGLVVREGMLFLQLSPVIGREAAIATPLAMRAWEVALEGFVTATMFAYTACARRKLGSSAERII